MAALVELVEVTTTDEVVLGGALGTPPSGTPAPRGFDAVLMMHGHSGSFSGSFYRNFSAALVARGYATLRTDNRGHDVVNRAARDGRLLGAAFEPVDDCVLDWRAWSEFLGRRGYARILLWGHSLGAIKSAWYLAHEHDPRIVGCILASPPRLNAANWSTGPDADVYAAHVAKARELIAGGHPDGVMWTAFPMAALSGAQAYLDKYASGGRYDVFRYVGEIRVPVLALTGADELPDVRFNTHVAEYAALAQRIDLEHVVVPNGDHYYSANQAFVVERVVDWIERRLPAS